jgi:hypothetical protein
MWTDWREAKGGAFTQLLGKTVRQRFAVCLNRNVVGILAFAQKVLSTNSMQRWGSGQTTVQTAVKTPEPLNRGPYELLKWGTKGVFLQCCATKTHHAPEVTELLFRESRKRFSPKVAGFAFSEVRAQKKKGKGPANSRPLRKRAAPNSSAQL